MVADGLLRTAAVLAAVDGLGFGICGIIGIQSLASGHGVAMVMGFPSYGGGPFEKYGIQSTVPLLSMFLAVCVLEIAAAWGLWDGSAWAAWLSLVLLVPGAVFWWGFALPFPPVFAAVRTVLVALRWKALA